MPSTITKGDSYNIINTYTTNNLSGSNVNCSSDLDINKNIINTNQLTILGNHNITCTVTTGAGKTTTITKNIEITYQAYTITNLITNGSFEDGFNNWEHSNVELSTNSYSGNYSLQFNHNNGNDFTAMTEQTLSLNAPILNHKYYGTLMFKSSNTFGYGITYDARFEWFYNDDAWNESNLIFTLKNNQINTWIKLSSIQEVTKSTYLSSNWRIRNFQRGTTEYSYCDDLILIDLTATFGSGNEPNKEWCDKHINYFDGTATIYM
ncbi:hypothetical protein EGW03_02010 [bacterium]|nr:hypothetical protein [bacterium]